MSLRKGYWKLKAEATRLHPVESSLSKIYRKTEYKINESSLLTSFFTTIAATASPHSSTVMLIHRDVSLNCCNKYVCNSDDNYYAIHSVLPFLKKFNPFNIIILTVLLHV
jgi:hypothetical protein